ncbi:MAG: ArsA family ATPase [Thermoplasmatota archaeon]
MSPARLSFVMGKGGVGRTTIATALAALHASRGERVLLVNSRMDRGTSRRLRKIAEPSERHAARGAAEEAGSRGAPATAAPAPILAPAQSATATPAFETLEVDEREVVDEIVHRLLKLGPMTHAVLRHPAYVSFTEIVPGIRELGLLNRLVEIRENRAHQFDRIVFDAPATGHGLHFLEAPDKASGLLVGRLKSRADAIRSLLRDPEATEVILVVLPEEVPVRETIELAGRLRAQGFPFERVIVNRWMPRVFVDPALTQVLDRLAADPTARDRLSRAIAHRSRIDVEQAVGALELVREERREAERGLQELQSLDAAVTLVPLIPDPVTRLTAVALALDSTKVGREVLQ